MTCQKVVSRSVSLNPSVFAWVVRTITVVKTSRFSSDRVQVS